MRRASIPGLVVTVMTLWLGACALDAGEPQSEITDDFELVTIEPDLQLGVDSPRIALPGDRLVPGPEAGACSCSTNECIEDWAVENLGCDLCVTIICSGGSSHVCTTCDADPSGENGWHHP